MRVGTINRVIGLAALVAFVGFVALNWVVPAMRGIGPTDAELANEDEVTARRYFRTAGGATLTYKIPPGADQLRVATLLEYPPPAVDAPALPEHVPYRIEVVWRDAERVVLEARQLNEWTRFVFVPNPDAGSATAAGTAVATPPTAAAQTRWHYLHEPAWLTRPRLTLITPPPGGRAVTVEVTPRAGGVEGAGAGTQLPAAFLVRASLRLSRTARQAERRLVRLTPKQRARLTRYEPVPATFVDDADLRWQLRREIQRESAEKVPGVTLEIREVLSLATENATDTTRRPQVLEPLSPGAVLVYNLAPGDRLRLGCDPPAAYRALVSCYGTSGLLDTVRVWLMPGLPRYVVPPAGTQTVTIAADAGSTTVPILVERRAAAGARYGVIAADRQFTVAVRLDPERGDAPLALGFPYTRTPGEPLRIAVSVPDGRGRRLRMSAYNRAGTRIAKGTLSIPAAPVVLDARASRAAVGLSGPRYWYVWVPKAVGRLEFSSDRAIWLGFFRELGRAARSVWLPRPASEVRLRALGPDPAALAARQAIARSPRQPGATPEPPRRTRAAVNPWQPVLPDDTETLFARGQVEYVVRQLARVSLRPRAPAALDPRPYVAHAPLTSTSHRRFLEPARPADEQVDRPGPAANVLQSASALYAYPVGDETLVTTAGTSLSGVLLIDAPRDADWPQSWLVVRVDGRAAWRHPVFPGVTTFSAGNLAPGTHRLAIELRDASGATPMTQATVRAFGNAPRVVGPNGAQPAYAVRSVDRLDPRRSLTFSVTLTVDTWLNLVVYPDLTGVPASARHPVPDDRLPAGLAERRAEDPNAARPVALTTPLSWITQLVPAPAIPGTPPPPGRSPGRSEDAVPAPPGSRAWLALSPRRTALETYWSTYAVPRADRIALYGDRRELADAVRSGLLLAPDMRPGRYTLTVRNLSAVPLWVRLFSRQERLPMPAAWSTDTGD